MVVELTFLAANDLSALFLVLMLFLCNVQLFLFDISHHLVGYCNSRKFTSLQPALNDKNKTLFCTITVHKIDQMVMYVITARIRRMGKVIFSQGSARSHPRGVPKSQVLSQVSGLRSFPGGTPVLAWRGGGVPSPGWGIPVLVRWYPSPSQGVPQSHPGLG